MSAMPYKLTRTNLSTEEAVSWTVPDDFLGMCFMRYPVAGANPIGLVKMKNHRLSQQYDSQWAAIETSAGVYDAAALAALDSIITFDRQNDISVIMGLYRTPRFYADNTTPNPSYTDYITKGPWEHYGECAHPTSLGAVADFVDMIISRYNLTGGAWYDQHGATLGKGIQYWEPWNEPPVNASSTNTNTSGDGAKATSFYWGNKNQLVDLCAVQHETVKALDPSVVVMTPGFSTSPATILTYLNTTGSEYAETTGADIADQVVWHPYQHGPKRMYFGTWLQDIVDGSYGIRTLRNTLAIGGYDFPLMISEWGVDGSGGGAMMDAWAAEDASFRFTWIARTLATMAAYGVQSIHPWHWLSDCCFGDLINDTDGVQAAYNWVADNLVGKTITAVRHYADGKVGLTVNGQELTV